MTLTSIRGCFYFILLYLWPWTTKPVIRVNFSKLRINKLSTDVWFIRIGQYLAEIQLFENLESEGAKKKIAFKVVQIKSLAMRITNQKLSFNIFKEMYKISSWNMIFT